MFKKFSLVSNSDTKFAGGFYSWRDAAEAGGHVPLLAPLPQPQEADRGQVLPPQQEHDHAETHQTLQVRSMHFKVLF